MAYRAAEAHHLFVAQAVPGRTCGRARAAPAPASLRRKLLCSRLAKPMRAPPLLLPVTQASRIAEASRARRCVRVASDESSTSAPCSPPSGAAGDLRARRRNSLNHTAVARLTKDPVLLKLLGGKQLSFIGGVKALDEQVELHGPEEGLRRMEELMRRHLSEQTKEGAKVRLPRVTGLSTRKLPAYAPRRSRLARRPGGDQARLGARRRRVRRVRQAAWGGTAPTVPQGAVMSACAAG